MDRLRALVTSPATEKAITGLIVINAITLGLETSGRAMAAFGGLLGVLDTALLAIFTVEIAARIAVHRGRFFADPWSLFDFIVVGVALIPATGNLSVLRSLRVLRALRLVSSVRSMRRVVGGLLHAIPGMGSIVALLLLIFYVAAVMATQMFGARFPEWFGTIGDSAYSLFQIMTLESWSMGIVRPLMVEFPLAWLFFVPFILATSFTVLNLFIGVIVDAMQSQHIAEIEEGKAEQHADAQALLAEIRAVKRELAALRGQLDAGPAGQIAGGASSGPQSPNV